MRKLLLIIFVFTLSNIFGQAGGTFTPGQYYDGVYIKENVNNRRFIPYTHLREADVFWSKRIWRTLDLREKQNHHLYFPVLKTPGRISLTQLLVSNILSGAITAFSDENFLKPIDIASIKQKLVKCDSVSKEEFDAEGNSKITKTFECDSQGVFKQILQIGLKEDWFFDKQKSVMECRILGIELVKLDEDKDNIAITLCYVYFPECRPIFASNDVYNPRNDGERRSFDDIFWKRVFSSYVTKESNVYDRNIEEFTKGLDALLESDRIKQGLFEKEHDLWQY
jgi:gliding motility associated protien GldN